MGVVSECCCKEVYIIIDILIINITFPYSTCINFFFWQYHPYFFVHFIMFFVLVYVIFLQCYN